MFSNQNFSSCEPLPSSNRSNTSTSAQHANTSSSASDEFFPRQLIAVSDDSPLTSNCTNSLDNNGSTTNDQSMELLRPTMLISQRYWVSYVQYYTEFNNMINAKIACIDTISWSSCSQWKITLHKCKWKNLYRYKIWNIMILYEISMNKNCALDITDEGRIKINI